jgi:hypothetical protein
MFRIVLPLRDLRPVVKMAGNAGGRGVDELEKAAKNLADTDAGWVHRRDGAAKLGEIAARALDVLRQFSDELDVDVHRAVDDALENASGALQGVTPVRQTSHYTLKELAEGLADSDKRTVAPHEDGYVVQLELNNDRTQAVFIMPHTLRDGAETIRVFTRCGAPTKESLEWALRANMKLSQGALAIRRADDGKKEFVIINCFLANELTPTELKDAVKRVAFYGDWVEQKLSDLDEF